jgi:hypothetical protein
MSIHSRQHLAVLAALAVTAAIAPAAAGAAGHAKPFTVTSTLTGKTVLPHRVRWVAVPSIPRSQVSKVEFLIDGKVKWVEHSAPYSYGFDDNYLVTTWLAPGVHRFKVRATANGGRRATSPTARARVVPAAAPPAQLATGPWKRTVAPAEAGVSPPGTYSLSIGKIGWRIEDSVGDAALVDVAYLSPGLLEARGGIHSKPNPPGKPIEGNPWCDEPFEPVRYRWSVQGTTLTMTLAGPKRCDGQSDIWAGVWTRG